MPAKRNAVIETISAMTDSMAKGNAPAVGAEQITEFLKSALQTERIAYLVVGRILAQVRDEKVFAKLNYPDLASYGRERLELCRATLYQYLEIFDWVAAHHPEWLDPAPGTFIPELNDVDDLKWMETKLSRPGMSKNARANLLELREKALNGTLAKSELRAFRGQTKGKVKDKRATFLAHMKALRKEGAAISGLPSEILTGLDHLIGMLKNDMAIPHLALEDAKTAQVA